MIIGVKVEYEKINNRQTTIQKTNMLGGKRGHICTFTDFVKQHALECHSGNLRVSLSILLINRHTWPRIVGVRSKACIASRLQP